jgi:hypothetical protein
MSPLTRRLSLALVAVLAALIAHPAAAQEVSWRTDYATALKESRDTNRPVFTYCTTDGCHWCRRLEATFQDPGVAQLLNARFVPLKLHAHKYGSILRELEVRAFPTLVHSAPDGTILSMTEGFRDPATLVNELQRTLDALATRVAAE